MFLRLECSSFLHQRIEGWKESRGLLSFDDLLKLTADAVSKHTSAGESIRQSLRQAFDAALIDEFQDTDPVQFQIFRELFADTQKHWLYLIGDPNNPSTAFEERIWKLIFLLPATREPRSIHSIEITVLHHPWSLA